MAHALIDWSSEENHILLNPRWPAEDLAFLQEQAETCLREKNLKAHLVVTSSGTSAESWRAVKLVFIAKKSFLAAAQAVVTAFQLNAEDVYAQSLPDFHVGGLGLQARAFLSGGRVVSMPPWKIENFIPFVEKESVSILSLVPAQIHDLVVAKVRAPSTVRLVFVGAGALVPAVEKEARLLGWPLVATFGMTETAAMIAGRTAEGEGMLPFPGVEGTLDANGLLRVKAPGLATGTLKWKNGQSKWEVLGDSLGWYQTQDRVRFENGRWLIEGRDRDFVKINGESVSVEALREIFLKGLVEKGISSSGYHLMACPDPRAGHRIVLITEPTVPLEKSSELREEYDRRVLPFERIHEISQVSEIPRTELGKVREGDLQERLREKAGKVTMEIVKSPWKKGAFFICEKCGRRDDGSGVGKDFAEDLKKQFKSRLKDEGHGKDIRVMTSSCLSLCPKKAYVAAWSPATGGDLSLIVFDPKREVEDLYDWLKKKV
ncbi:MAG: AMP-binding protein [Bdellovibrionaceae bacterium]|nr:AMP-binding protein [Pseudobdellovibrionaceae bacterium]